LKNTLSSETEYWNLRKSAAAISQSSCQVVSHCMPASHWVMPCSQLH